MSQYTVHTIQYMYIHTFDKTQLRRLALGTSPDGLGVDLGPQLREAHLGCIIISHSNMVVVYNNNSNNTSSKINNTSNTSNNNNNNNNSNSLGCGQTGSALMGSLQK